MLLIIAISTFIFSPYIYGFSNLFRIFSNAIFLALILFFSSSEISAKVFPLSNSNISSNPNPLSPLGLSTT